MPDDVRRQAGTTRAVNPDDDRFDRIGDQRDRLRPARVELDLAREVAEKNGRALEHAHEDDGLPVEVAGDLVRHFADAARNLIPGEQDSELRTHGSGGIHGRLW